MYLWKSSKFYHNTRTLKWKLKKKMRPLQTSVIPIVAGSLAWISEWFAEVNLGNPYLKEILKQIPTRCKELYVKYVCVFIYLIYFFLDKCAVENIMMSFLPLRLSLEPRANEYSTYQRNYFPKGMSNWTILYLPTDILYTTHTSSYCWVLILILTEYMWPCSKLI